MKNLFVMIVFKVNYIFKNTLDGHFYLLITDFKILQIKAK